MKITSARWKKLAGIIVECSCEDNDYEHDDEYPVDFENIVDIQKSTNPLNKEDKLEDEIYEVDLILP